MSDTKYEVIFTTNYRNTNQTREYTFTSDSVSAAVETVRTKANNINDSLTSGAASIVAGLFVSNDYDPSENIGTLTSISNVKVKETIRTEIPITRAIEMRMINEEINEREESNNGDENIIDDRDAQR